MISSKAQLLLMLLLIFQCQTGASCQTVHCSSAAAEKADYEASRVKTWDELYHSYLRYSVCDDGSIGEGYSDSVVRLLAHRWSTFPKALPLFASNTGFRKFVLRHIDATTGNADLEIVRANAIGSCPVGGNKYCLLIRRAAEAALRDNGDSSPEK